MADNASKTSGLMSGLRSSYASGGNPVPQTSQQPPQTQANVSSQLNDLDQIMTDVESQRGLGQTAQAIPQAVNQATQPQQPFRGARQKERIPASPAQATSPEYPGGVQSVEQEKTPEIPPEVESFLQHAESHEDQLPQEIVVADNQEISTVTHHPKQPVIVLPITEEEHKLGKKKSTKFSLRWLVEWSIKLMKKFTGKVVYRQEE